MKARIAERIAAVRERDCSPESQQQAPAQPRCVRSTERHYSPEEIAEIWGVHATTVKRLIEDVPGVLKLGRVNTKDKKRRYTMLRVPESVLEKLHEEMTK